jgi:two-component system, cell cycle response regulator CpdR
LRRLLIVDDEDSIRALLSAVFVRAGYQVHVTSEASGAKNALQSEQFDLMLSDIVMPGMDGHELAQWVALHHPETRTLLMSAYDPECRGCIYSPRCTILAKPFTLREAITAVEQALGVPAPSWR